MIWSKVPLAVVIWMAPFWYDLIWFCKTALMGGLYYFFLALKPWWWSIYAIFYEIFCVLLLLVQDSGRVVFKWDFFAGSFMAIASNKCTHSLIVDVSQWYIKVWQKSNNLLNVWKIVNQFVNCSDLLGLQRMTGKGKTIKKIT